MNQDSLKPLLIVEDNPGLQRQLKWAFPAYRVHLAADRPAALAMLEEHRPAVVTLDLGLPPDTANASEGLMALEEILRIAPHTKVIVVTGNDDRQNALKAVSMGAYDFYQKPVEPEILALIVDRACRLHELEEENRWLNEQAAASAVEGIIGASAPIQAACRLVEKVSRSDITALIVGESGTGKELFAKALHRLSQRNTKPFVAVNCAAIPRDLLESELFGHEKGAFTGAVKQTRGKIEFAQGGTLFLDEIGDMPMALQAKLLRFLQERVIERVGGRETIPVDVRIIAATNRRLEESIGEGAFREDLFYRLSEISIKVPALRDRQGDAILLAKSFLEKYCAEQGRRIRGFSDEALQQIEAHDWPGNVRELENRIKRAVVIGEGAKITPEDMGFAAGEQGMLLDLRTARERAERQVVKQALLIHDYNISRAAEALGISRPSLYNLMKKFDISENQRS